MSDSSQLSRVLEGMDPTVRPQDDLFRAINGSWLDSYEIPADLPGDGAFIQLRLASEADVHAIIEDLAATHPTEGEPAKIAALFNSWMDTDTLNAKGTSPLREDLDPIEAAETKDELARVIGRLMHTGITSFFVSWVGSDANDPDSNILTLRQAGLGLPDEAYYREEQHAETLAKYQAFIPGFLTLVLGLGHEEAGQRAETILGVEKKFAATHLTVVESRDAANRNNPMTLSDFAESAEGFPWEKVLEESGAPMQHLARVNIAGPAALIGSARVWAEASLEELKAYTLWRVVLSRSGFLTEEIDQAGFDFYGRVISGTTVQRERWKRGVAVVESTLGEAIGKEYVKRHFPASHKEKMLALVEDLLEAYRRSIRDLDWMGEETKKRALAKVDSFTPKIGYPDSWHDYSALEIGDDLMANVRAAARWASAEEYAKLGKPVDRSEWLMTPQTVNAYYYPLWNEIVFPAAILQFPFFDPERDAALNYGGIGAVIGHEIGHGFDDQGSKYDADGSLNNWWTDADRAAFEERTAALVAQYEQYVPADLQPDGPHVIGALTLGENIGDLGGLSIAIKAYGISLEREGKTFEDAPVIDGYTGLQRVFLSWARVWQGKNRREMAITRIATDPHSPAEFRANGVVKNIDAFAEAFGLKEGDGLYLAPEERVRIW